MDRDGVADADGKSAKERDLSSHTFDFLFLSQYEYIHLTNNSYFEISVGLN